MDIRKGDTVLVITGKDKGRRGKVLQVKPDKGWLFVENINLVWKHPRARGRQARAFQLQTQRIQTPAPLLRSKLMLICPRCEKPTRVKHIFVEEGRKVRACKKCGEAIDQ